MPDWGHTSFNSSPLRWTTSLPAFGLMHSQSIPGGAGSVPLLSTAMRKPPAWSASISAASSCSSGSPPVITTNRWSRPSPHAAATASASAPPRANLPPPGPSVPTKSVSQNWHTALARSTSRPLHKLHPAKRKNTARLPACIPSPCSVRKISFTA